MDGLILIHSRNLHTSLGDKETQHCPELILSFADYSVVDLALGASIEPQGLVYLTAKGSSTD